MKLAHAFIGAATAFGLATSALLTLAPGARAEDSTALDPSLTQIVESTEQIAPLGTPAEVGAGHVDLGPKFIDGQWMLLARDDTAETPTWRNLDDLVFRVNDQAQLSLPEGDDTYSFIHADGPVWAVPQTEIAQVVWLGWNTQDPEVAGRLAQGATLVFEGHEGEGDFHVFVQAGNFSGPQELWNSTKETAQPIHIEANTHTHANWIFTKPGIHLVRLSIQATLNDGTQVEDTQILRFAVGAGADATRAREAQWTLTTAPESPAEVATPSALDSTASFPFIIAIGLGAGILVLLVVVIFLRGRRLAREREAARSVENSRDRNRGNRDQDQDRAQAEDSRDTNEDQP